MYEKNAVMFFSEGETEGAFQKTLFFRWHEFSLYKWVELQQISHDRKMRDFFFKQKENLMKTKAGREGKKRQFAQKIYLEQH